MKPLTEAATAMGLGKTRRMGWIEIGCMMVALSACMERCAPGHEDEQIADDWNWLVDRFRSDGRQILETALDMKEEG